MTDSTTGFTPIFQPHTTDCTIFNKGQTDAIFDAMYVYANTDLPIDPELDVTEAEATAKFNHQYLVDQVLSAANNRIADENESEPSIGLSIHIKVPESKAEIVRAHLESVVNTISQLCK